MLSRWWERASSVVLLHAPPPACLSWLGSTKPHLSRGLLASGVAISSCWHTCVAMHPPRLVAHRKGLVAGKPGMLGMPSRSAPAAGGGAMQKLLVKSGMLGMPWGSTSLGAGCAPARHGLGQQG